MPTTGLYSYVVDDYWLCDYCDPCLAPDHGGGSGGRKKPEKPDKPPKRDKPPKARRSFDNEPGADFSLVDKGAASFLEASAEPPAPIVYADPDDTPVDLSRAYAALASASSILADAGKAHMNARLLAAQSYNERQQQLAAQRNKLAKIAAVVNAVLTQGVSE